MTVIAFNSFFDEMNKIAEEQKREHPVLTVAKGVGGLGLGAGLGYVGMHGLDKGIKALGGKGVSPGVIRYGGPAVGTAAALGYGLLQNKMLDRVKANLKQEEPNDRIAEGSGV